jgi:protein-S-isoprenylcysteine O-methyltransferase Ste14
MFIAIPIAFDSWWALLLAALAIALLVVRASLEDRLLKAELSGYVDYARRMRYRAPQKDDAAS